MPYCGECRQECSWEIEDHGYGRGEFWGVPYNNVRLVVVSSCCGSNVYDNEECTIDFEQPEPEPHEPDKEDR